MGTITAKHLEGRGFFCDQPGTWAKEVRNATTDHRTGPAYVYATLTDGVLRFSLSDEYRLTVTTPAELDRLPGFFSLVEWVGG